MFVSTAHAMIAGNEHYFTFDDQIFDFASQSCNYVLAHDFIDGRFSIIVDYQQEGGQIMKSLTILSNGKNIQISPNFKVNVSTWLIFLLGHYGDKSFRKGPSFSNFIEFGKQ